MLLHEAEFAVVFVDVVFLHPVGQSSYHEKVIIQCIHPSGDLTAGKWAIEDERFWG